MGMQQPLTRSAETPGQQAADLGLLGAAYRNRTDDLFITRELHTRRALNWLASAVSTKATQQGQHDQIEVMYAQNTPARIPPVVWTCAVERRDTSVLHESVRPHN